MSIKRAPRPVSNYTIISNGVLRNSELSFRARGILASILSRPDNWRTTADSLARESKEGRTAILTSLKELENAGYLVRRKWQNDLGHWMWESIVYDTVQNPQYGKPTSDKPTSDEPTSENLTIKEEELYTNNYEESVVAPLAQLLADLIESNGSKRPTVSKQWIQELERMQRIDGRTLADIEAMIRWSQSNTFWRANILSPKKLRSKFDQMRLQAEAAEPKATGASAWLQMLNSMNESNRLELEQ